MSTEKIASNSCQKLCLSGLRSGLQNNLRGKNILVILQIDENNVDETATLVADFRVELNSYKGIEARPDIQEGKEDLLYFLKAQYPVFVAKEDGKAVGYLVCRIEDEVL